MCKITSSIPEGFQRRPLKHLAQPTTKMACYIILKVVIPGMIIIITIFIIVEIITATASHDDCFTIDVKIPNHDLRSRQS